MLYIAIFAVLGLAVALAWVYARETANRLPGGLPPFEAPGTDRHETGVPKRFIVVDLETTGLHCHRHEIIEIGAIKITLEEDVHPTFQALIIPKKRISAKITELTGLNREILKRDGSPIEEILPQFLEFCEDLPLVAFNAEFDRGFLEAACLRCGHSPPGASWICALELSRRAWPRRSNYRLSALARDGGCDMGNEHRAIDDCRRAMEIFLMAAVELRGRGQRAVRLT